MNVAAVLWEAWVGMWPDANSPFFPLIKIFDLHRSRSATPDTCYSLSRRLCQELDQTFLLNNLILYSSNLTSQYYFQLRFVVERNQSLWSPFAHSFGVSGLSDFTFGLWKPCRTLSRVSLTCTNPSTRWALPVPQSYLSFFKALALPGWNLAAQHTRHNTLGHCSRKWEWGDSLLFARNVSLRSLPESHPGVLV